MARTNKEKTMNALNGSFLNTATNRINEDYLNDVLEINLQNVEYLYQALRNTRRTPEATVFLALMHEANQRLVSDNYPLGSFYASNEQLKAWLQKYGRGYETLSKMVEYVKKYREEDDK